MSWHRRSFPHQNLKARQGPQPNTSLVPGFQPTTSQSAPTATNTPPGAGNNGNGGGNNGNGNGGGKGSDKTTASPPAASASSQTQSTNTAPASNSAPNESLTTSSGPLSSATVTSASSINTLSVTSNVNTTPTLTRAVSTPNVGPSTAIYTYTSLAGSAAPPASTGTSSSDNSNSVGGMSTGAVVGAVAGGLFGLICLIALGSYILRWWNKRSAERDFVDDYNPPNTNPGDFPSSDFSPPMTQHHSAPSLSSSAGVAGQGVLASRGAPAMAGPGAYRGGYGGYDDESINGPYSSQPQVQAPYNPESYGQYASYNPDPGYQEAMRGYQGQRGYEAPTNIGYAVSGPSTPQQAVPAALTPRATSPKTTAAAAIAAAHAAAATHVPAASPSAEQRQSAVYNEEDAYGGF